VQLRDTRGEGPDSGSYTVSVELVSTSGKRRTVRRSFVGEAGQVPTSPTVFKGRVVWGVSWNDRPAQVWRYDISTRQLTMAWLSDELYMFAPTSPTAGFGMRYTAAYQEDERGELVRIENIPPGAKRQR